MNTITELKNLRKEMISDITAKIKDQVTYSIIVHSEEIPIRGNASAIDEKTDLEVEQSIIEQLESGNEWAWCSVEVVAEFNELKASDYLGACSYKSEDDFKSGGYYEDMKERAFEQLVDDIQKLQIYKKAGQ